MDLAELNQTIKYVDNNPKYSLLHSKVYLTSSPKMKDTNKRHDATLFKLAVKFAVVDEEYSLPKITELNDTEAYKKTALEAFIKKVWDCNLKIKLEKAQELLKDPENYAGRRNGAAIIASIKELKTLLNKFARENGLNCRIENPGKVDHRFYSTTETTQTLTEEENKVTIPKYVFVEDYNNQKKYYDEDHKVIELDYIKHEDRKKIARDGAIVKPENSRPSRFFNWLGLSWFTGNNFFIRALCNTGDFFTNNSKKWHNRRSIAISAIVGVGEGLVAGALLGAAIIPSIFVMLAAGAVNYVLLRNAMNITLKDLFMKKTFINERGNEKTVEGLYLDENGKEVSPEPATWRNFYKHKKFWIKTGLYSCIAAGGSFGILSFASGLSSVGSFFLGVASLTVAACPPVLLGLIVITATVTAIGLAGLYYRSIANLVKNKPIQKIKDYFHENLNFFNYEKAHKYNSKLSKAEFYTSRVFNWFFSVFITTGLALMFATGSFGMFFQKSMGFAHKTAGLSRAWSTGLSVAVVGFGSIVNTIFQVQSINSAMEWITTTGLKLIGAVIASPFILLGLIGMGISALCGHKSSKSRLKGWFDKPFEGKTGARTINNILSGIGYVVLGGCLAANAYAQGCGGKIHDPVWFNRDTIGRFFAHTLRFSRTISNTAISWLNVVSLTLASFGATIVEIYDKCTVSGKLNQETIPTSGSYVEPSCGGNHSPTTIDGRISTPLPDEGAPLPTQQPQHFDPSGSTRSPALAAAFLDSDDSARRPGQIRRSRSSGNLAPRTATTGLNTGSRSRSMSVPSDARVATA